MKTLVVDFYLPHLRDGIIKLHEERIIDINYWLVDEEGKYASENVMHKSSFGILHQEYLQGSRFEIADEIYEYGYKYLYPFMNIDNRWKISTETCTYVHDFNMLFQIWHHIIKSYQIELLLMGNAPHGPVPFMAYVVANALGIKIIITEQAWYAKERFLCFHSLERIGCDYLDRDLGVGDVTPEMRGGFRQTPFYMKNMPKKILASGRFHIFPTIKRALCSNLFFSKVKEHKGMFLYKVFERLAYRVVEFYLEKNFAKYRDVQCKELDRLRKYVYFPLHLQPEMTTDTLGGIYEDQLLALERLARILPEDHLIYVKENPAQTYYKRNAEFFCRLGAIHKVVLVHPNTDTYDLMENAVFVATITGTAGWEAITAGKPCLCFGYAWYRSMVGVIQYHAGIKFDDIVGCHFTRDEFLKSYERFYKSLFPGIVAGSRFSDLTDSFSVKNNNEKLYHSLKCAIEHYDG